MTHQYSESWHGVEGVRDGKLELSRVRNLSDNVIQDLHFPYHFIITRRYVSQDDTMLPSANEYSAISRFEKSIIDEIEGKQLGILAWTRTGNEIVKYYLYVRDIEAVAQLINNHVRRDEQVDMAADKDQNWKAFQDMKNTIGL